MNKDITWIVPIIQILPAPVWVYYYVEAYLSNDFATSMILLLFITPVGAISLVISIVYIARYLFDKKDRSRLKFFVFLFSIFITVLYSILTIIFII
jgi:hypothetical protein